MVFICSHVYLININVLFIHIGKTKLKPKFTGRKLSRNNPKVYRKSGPFTLFWPLIHNGKIPHVFGCAHELEHNGMIPHMKIVQCLFDIEWNVVVTQNRILPLDLKCTYFSKLAESPRLSSLKCTPWLLTSSIFFHHFLLICSDLAFLKWAKIPVFLC